MMNFLNQHAYKTTADFLLTIAILSFVYLVTAVGAGFFRAWAAKKVGDDTGEQLGFLSLNPLAYIDVFGLAIYLMLHGVGWGRHVPINPFNIYEPNKKIKIAFAYFSDTIAHFVMALVVMIGQVVAFQLLDFAALSPLVKIGVSVMVAFIRLNMLMVVISLIINTLSLILASLSRDVLHESPSLYYLIMFAPFILIIGLGPVLFGLVSSLIAVLSVGLTHLFGLM